MRDFAHPVVTEHDKYPTLTGGTMMPSWYPVVSNVPQGMTVAACQPAGGPASPWRTASRRARARPSRPHGRAALRRQVPARGPGRRHAAQCQVRAPGRRRRRGPAAPAAYLRGFLDLPIYHTQFNVVDDQLLRCARPSPTSTARCRCGSPATRPSSWNCTKTSRTTSSRARPTSHCDGGRGTEAGGDGPGRAGHRDATVPDAAERPGRAERPVFDVQRFSLHDGPGSDGVFPRGARELPLVRQSGVAAGGPEIAWFREPLRRVRALCPGLPERRDHDGRRPSADRPPSASACGECADACAAARGGSWATR